MIFSGLRMLSFVPATMPLISNPVPAQYAERKQDKMNLSRTEHMEKSELKSLKAFVDRIFTSATTKETRQEAMFALVDICERLNRLLEREVK
jgi:hypothetical protein